MKLFGAEVVGKIETCVLFSTSHHVSWFCIWFNRSEQMWQIVFMCVCWRTLAYYNNLYAANVWGLLRSTESVRHDVCINCNILTYFLSCSCVLYSGRRENPWTRNRGYRVLPTGTGQTQSSALHRI